MNGTSLIDIKNSIATELEEKGIEPNLDNILDRLREMLIQNEIDGEVD